MAKRKAIDYTPQFGGGLFRPKDEVDQELARLEATDAGATNAAIGKRANERPNERTNGSHDERPGHPGQAGEGKQAERAEQARERVRVRHSFDVFKDQITALTAIQAERFSRTGTKPKLGELVQQALDDYIRGLSRED